MAQELVNCLQNLRKDQGLAVTDKIEITLAPGHAFVQEAVQQHKDYICYETQALDMRIVEQLEEGTTFDMDGYLVQVQVTPAP